jgi:hypothetical protein
VTVALLEKMGRLTGGIGELLRCLTVAGFLTGLARGMVKGSPSLLSTGSEDLRTPAF